MQSGDVVTLMVFFFAILFISVILWAVPVRLWIEAESPVKVVRAEGYRQVVREASDDE